jgi:hypothetical protein
MAKGCVFRLSLLHQGRAASGPPPCCAGARVRPGGRSRPGAHGVAAGARHAARAGRPASTTRRIRRISLAGGRGSGRGWPGAVVSAGKSARQVKRLRRGPQAPGWQRRDRHSRSVGGCGVAIPSPPSQAKPSRPAPGCQGRTSSRALHLVTLGQACSTRCGTTATGWQEGKVRRGARGTHGAQGSVKRRQRAAIDEG